MLSFIACAHVPPRSLSRVSFFFFRRLRHLLFVRYSISHAALFATFYLLSARRAPRIVSLVQLYRSPPPRRGTPSLYLSLLSRTFVLPAQLHIYRSPSLSFAVSLYLLPHLYRRRIVYLSPNV
ncbi:hypothetical protein C8Q70DRAFT_1115642 [Cubamyces menziesii]|nr:hypothetical protein C8Q70DRAFT_1115642 [Cubamyces menziesii]